MDLAIGADDPTTSSAVWALFDSEPRLIAHVDGPGPRLETCAVEVRIVDGEGRPQNRSGLACWLVADDPADWSPDEPERIPVDGRCEFRGVGVGALEVQIREDRPQGKAISQARGTVENGDTLTLDILVD